MEWISVEERLPEGPIHDEYNNVSVLTSDGYFVRIIEYNVKDHIFWYSELTISDHKHIYDRKIAKVKFWMPLPKPPDVE